MVYLVLMANDPDELTDKVNLAIEAGWKPQGGVSIMSLGMGMRQYAQAVIKELQSK